MTRPKIGDAWNRFWFTPQPTSPVALFRIAVGTVALGWAFGLLPGLQAFFSSTGIEPVGIDTTWGLFAHVHSDAALFAGWAALVLSSLCVIVGFRTKVASVAQFVLVFSFIERSMAVFNSGDGLVRIAAFLLVFMPAGESLSVDRWRRDPEHFWEFPERAPWALRLMQVQISVLYLSSAREKLVGGGWADGTALSYVWRMDDIVRFHVPDAVIRSATTVALATFLAFAVELLIGVFVWVRSARPLVLGLGIALHIAIDLTLRIGFFSAILIATYVAFLSPDTASSLILRVRHRWWSHIGSTKRRKSASRDDRTRDGQRRQQQTGPADTSRKAEEGASTLRMTGLVRPAEQSNGPPSGRVAGPAASELQTAICRRRLTPP